MTSIKYVIGDATEPIGTGTKFICHVCNNIGAWGAGFVLALSEKWKRPEELYRSLSSRYLGNNQIVGVGSNTYVVNMIAQKGIRPDKRSKENPIPLQYWALNVCLVDLASHVDRDNSVHMPRIGCGLAGGDWSKVEAIIQLCLCDRGIPVTVYDLPNEERRC